VHFQLDLKCTNGTRLLRPPEICHTSLLHSMSYCLIKSNYVVSKSKIVYEIILYQSQLICFSFFLILKCCIWKIGANLFNNLFSIISVSWLINLRSNVYKCIVFRVCICRMYIEKYIIDILLNQFYKICAWHTSVSKQ
jgi:hypothetical protein